MKVCLISNNTNQWNTTTPLSQSARSTGKQSKQWNSKLPDGSVKSTDFERDVTMLEEISDPITIERDREDTSEEIQYSHIYLSEIEQNKMQNQHNQKIGKAKASILKQQIIIKHVFQHDGSYQRSQQKESQ